MNTDTEVAMLIQSLRFQCRLRDLSFLNPAHSDEKVARISASLGRLAAGRYVIGVGPYCGEVIKIGNHPIRLGRHASLLEEPHEEVVDYVVNDASLLGPCEVSRLHATLDGSDCDKESVMLSDETSSTGTWLQPQMQRIDPETPTCLSHGDMFSLGGSGTNLFLVFVKK